MNLLPTLLLYNKPTADPSLLVNTRTTQAPAPTPRTIEPITVELVQWVTLANVNNHFVARQVASVVE